MRRQSKTSTITLLKRIAVDTANMQNYPAVSFYIRDKLIASYYNPGESFILVNQSIKLTEAVDIKTLDVEYSYEEQDLIRAFVELESLANDF